eukprot:CAMPEP_0181074396 /NCGR_PEP_ID=MMETSP1070-20121207/29579_1 /TAXON_ID=265543 /ORGANISM="Minutocellus polymorphus, Strain NH13" /LENGTH=137 /DNA_ID=CAMNT_0023155509 /DNA_START=55 /DNA_END=468 /DNA_ORIENTATION=-
MTKIQQQDLYLYTYVWEGSRNFVSAFLASAIRDNISRNEEEESTELGISKDLIRGETTPFGLISTKDPQQARIVVYDFNNELYTTDLNALSILAVDNNPLLDITAGVIHPKVSCGREFLFIVSGTVIIMLPRGIMLA